MKKDFDDNEKILVDYFNKNHDLIYFPNQEVINDGDGIDYFFKLNSLEKINSLDENFICLFKQVIKIYDGEDIIQYFYLFYGKNNEIFEYTLSLSNFKDSISTGFISMSHSVVNHLNENLKVDNNFHFNSHSKIIIDIISKYLTENNFKAIEFIKRQIAKENNLGILYLLNKN